MRKPSIALLLTLLIPAILCVSFFCFMNYCRKGFGHSFAAPICLEVQCPAFPERSALFLTEGMQDRSVWLYVKDTIAGKPAKRKLGCTYWQAHEAEECGAFWSNDGTLLLCKYQGGLEDAFYTQVYDFKEHKSFPPPCQPGYINEESLAAFNGQIQELIAQRGGIDEANKISNPYGKGTNLNLKDWESLRKDADRK